MLKLYAHRPMNPSVVTAQKSNVMNNKNKHNLAFTGPGESSQPDGNLLGRQSDLEHRQDNLLGRQSDLEHRQDLLSKSQKVLEDRIDTLENRIGFLTIGQYCILKSQKGLEDNQGFLQNNQDGLLKNQKFLANRLE